MKKSITTYAFWDERKRRLAMDKKNGITIKYFLGLIKY